MKYLKVKLWGKEIGRLVWDATTRCTYFVYNFESKDIIPDISPMLSPADRRNMISPIYGDERPAFQGLPPFISDSLPDSWGNILFDRWVKENNIPRNKITPLYKLTFIGKRGMGALEYEPASIELAHACDVDLKALYDMSLKVLKGKEGAIITPDEQLTLQALLTVGTSAGGRQMKAIISIDKSTGVIRSGQNDGLEGYDYYILKFGSQNMPIAEIENAYYEMAKSAGIEMEESRLFRVEGVNHFLTRRFDRKDGKKVHVQTLAAMNPQANSYEDIIATCRSLHINESEIGQIYRRMVFNVMSNNTDDHNKNFAFLLEEGGRWRIAPAYDITFIFNEMGTGRNIHHRISLCGKTAEITKADLIGFAADNDICDASAIIDDVANSLAKFGEYAEENNIRQPWRGLIQKTISDHLKAFGYLQAAAD